MYRSLSRPHIVVLTASPSSTAQPSPTPKQQDIWFNKNKKEASLRGAWFYRTEDIPAKIIQKLQRIKRKRDDGNRDPEVFLSNDLNTNSAETVLKRVAVIYSDDTEEIVAAKREWAGRHGCETFECGYFYKTKTGRFNEYARAANRAPGEPMMTAAEEKKIVAASTWAPDLTEVPEIVPPSLTRESSSAVTGVRKDGHSLESRKPSVSDGPFMGLERRKSATFMDPDAGKYSFSIFGGTSFRVDGSLIAKRGERGVNASASEGGNRPRKRARTSREGGSNYEGGESTGPDEWHRKACRLIEDLENHRLGGDSSTHVETAAPFFVPVAQIKDEVQGYTDVIADPIDLCQIKANLGMGSTADSMGRKEYDVHQEKEYHTFAAFLADVRRVFSNCLQFNQVSVVCRCLSITECLFW